MEKEPYNQKELTEFALKVAGDIGATIAIPVSTLIFIAKKIELIFEGKNPQLIAVAILASFLISTVAISKKALKYGEQYERLTGGDTDVIIADIDETQDKNIT